MLKGLDSFRRKFGQYSDCYTIIGGAACEILLENENFRFRATKDIDMILIIEARQIEFGRAFWEYIREGGYKCGWKNSESVHFYRFTEPKEGYPIQIELFSRIPDNIMFPSAGIVPIHISDDISSLSAILLNDDYYQFMMEGRKIINDIGVLDAEHIIPFKMYAWLDLKRRKEAGEHVNEGDLKKHKYDVFRLLQIVQNREKIVTNGLVRDNTVRFMHEIQDEDLSLRQIGLPFTKDEAVAFLSSIYI